MPFCPNCGSQVGETHHYCSSCGRALSDIAESEDDAPMLSERDGLLTSRSISYVHDLTTGAQELDRESVAYRQLQQDFGAGLADFARLSAPRDLNLPLLWTGGFDSVNSDISIDAMNSHQFEDRLTAVALHRILEFYDDALGTDFKSEFKTRLGEAIDILENELDEGEPD